jgi:glycosyltransferase involved in cell wall biosynthesis
MKILFVADGRSPIALNWIQHFVQNGHEVHLVSTYPCSPALPLASLHTIPTAFGQVAGDIQPAGRNQRSSLRYWMPVGLRVWLRQTMGVLTLPRAARRLNETIQTLMPDLIHALRIPFEGMLTSMARSILDGIDRPRFVLSTWGNDFTLHARANPWMTRLTRKTIAAADALHTDCARDQLLAREWGFDGSKPWIVLPGNGGIDRTIFYPPAAERSDPIVIHPRGIRGYVRNDTFFRAVALVLAHQPDARFICTEMAGEASVLRWVDELGIAHRVSLLPRQSRPQLADLFRAARVVVSITTHDGTPNTLLEAMACGCFPVAGDIASLREWITPGVNGALAAPDSPSRVAEAILIGLNPPDWARLAAARNLQIIAQRADYPTCMNQAEQFYRNVYEKG